jgi:hypothetical protein
VCGFLWPTNSYSARMGGNQEFKRGGWGIRRIAWELKISHNTLRNYVRTLEPPDPELIADQILALSDTRHRWESIPKHSQARRIEGRSQGTCPCRTYNVRPIKQLRFGAGCFCSPLNRPPFSTDFADVAESRTKMPMMVLTTKSSIKAKAEPVLRFTQHPSVLGI